VHLPQIQIIPVQSFNSECALGNKSNDLLADPQTLIAVTGIANQMRKLLKIMDLQSG
jgi:hypothetical protein